MKSPTYEEIAEENLKLKEKIKELECNDDMAGGCLDMIKEYLEQMGTDMSNTPAMMYPEAIHSTIYRMFKDSEDTIFWKVVTYCKENPEIVKVIIRAIENGETVNCEEPHKCDKFPCESLTCNKGKK